MLRVHLPAVRTISLPNPSLPPLSRHNTPTDHQAPRTACQDSQSHRHSHTNGTPCIPPPSDPFSVMVVPRGGLALSPPQTGALFQLIRPLLAVKRSENGVQYLAA